MIIHPRQGVEKDLVNAGVASANEERRLGLNLSELWLIGMSFFLLLLFLVFFLFFYSLFSFAPARIRQCKAIRSVRYPCLSTWNIGLTSQLVWGFHFLHIDKAGSVELKPITAKCR